MTAHAVVLGLWPFHGDAPDALPASVLQVSLLDPVPLASQADPVPGPGTRDNDRAPAPAQAKPRTILPAPAPAMQQFDERRSFAVGAEVPELSAAAEPAAPAAVPVAPPSFDAAYLSNPPPRYPMASRRAGEQGTVMLRVLVSREGAAARVELERSSGSAHLDAAARETVKAWRFTPARRGAEAIESWMIVPVVFRLEGSS